LPTAGDSGLFSLKPEAIIELPGGKTHVVRAACTFDGDARTIEIPFKIIGEPKRVRTHVSARIGFLPPKGHPDIEGLGDVVRGIDRVKGTYELGWTPERDAFAYDGTMMYVSDAPTTRYTFVAPEGTLVHLALDALTPKGSADTQRRNFKKLWADVWHFKLALALVTVSPFLEIVGAPSMALHFAGKTGMGKTTVLRNAISAFSDPDSPLTRIDFSKDTPNYTDAQLGVLKDFPIFIDETTLRTTADIIAAAYHISTGRTKGRLTGSDQNYLPAETDTYRLVCLLAGETPIRGHIDKGGGAARFMELVISEPIVPKKELGKWYMAASSDYGHYGRELVNGVITHYFKDGRNGRGLVALYTQARANVETWTAESHSRLIDALACIQLGYYLAAKTLEAGFRRGLSDGRHTKLIEEAQAFARGVYDQLNKVTKLDTILDAIVAHETARKYAERGFIPLRFLDELYKDLGYDTRQKLTAYLVEQGAATKTESRKDDLDNSARSLILSAKGKEWFAERSKNHGDTTQAVEAQG
jgi:hypothetical protein